MDNQHANNRNGHGGTGRDGGSEGASELEKGRAHNKRDMPQIPSTPSGNLYPAMISRDGYMYAEPIPTMVVRLSVLVPANGHLPLVLGPIVRAD